MSEEKIICRCEEVSEQEILNAIKDGGTTVDGVKRRTRACMGLCQGKTCGTLVQRMIVQNTDKKPEDVKPQKSRMPVRPVEIKMFGGHGND
ncbi:MAG: (2Fe-2S)-binding protein [Anaerotignaceae bacterium]